MSKGIIEELYPLGSFQLLEEYIINKEDVIAETLDSQKIHVYGALEKLDKKSFFLCSSEDRAKEIYNDLKYFSKREVYLYPVKDMLFYNADLKSIGIVRERQKILNKLLSDENIIVVAPIDSLFQRLIPKDIYLKNRIHLDVGTNTKIEDLKKGLINFGFKEVKKIQSSGEFSIRGGIVDIFGTEFDRGIRLEFWDTEIDSIRLLDSYGERSIEKLDSITVLPVKELLFDKETKQSAIEKIKLAVNKTKEKFKKKGLNEEYDNMEKEYSRIIEEMEEDVFLNYELYFDFFYDDSLNILDYIDSDTLLFIDEYQRIKSIGENLYNEFYTSIENKIFRGKLLSSCEKTFLQISDINSKLDKFQKVFFQTIYSSNDFNIENTVSFKSSYISITKNHFDLLAKDLVDFKKQDYKTVILCGNKSSGLKLRDELTNYNVIAHFVDDIEETELQKGAIYISSGSLNRGFSYPELKLNIISDREIFGSKKLQTKKKVKNKNTRKIDSFNELKIGDYVVHETYGIGIFCGVDQIRVEGIIKDFISIEYAGGGSLNVPITQLDRVQKYIGSEGKVKIHKLGGTKWNASKEKTRKNLEIVARELIELYAKRRAQTGFVFSKDSLWQKEFEDKFPFDETLDQTKAIEDVKTDMEQAKVMDRLICGDVGYGKTEVALRAAFKAVQDGKQVAFLCPTTILAKQHYNTFMERMKDYPISVDYLSRFKTPANNKKTINQLKTGFVDIVIGTHRLLSKDVKFKDLGLIVVDEEQRFGVTHKEKLKTLKENVDVITLTATPIPRTLHMSLTGIRDISILDEPPSIREPIRTFVMEYDRDYVKDAINRELSRNGQIYFLHNQVKDIEEKALELAEMFPNARVAYAHGQMSINSLETIMKEFIDGEINILVCTTIIETGLDIGNVNTIIINNSDRMGLSQLYQLRGRVGRTNKKSYAYLMYKKDKVLKEVAEKRLEALKEFTDLGSGFKISMRDLEIRGAGSVLGNVQHGHIDTVGYDMYCKLLDRAIKELEGVPVKEDVELKVDLKINGYISEKYIEDEMQRIDVYKKIAFISSKDDYYDLEEELEDRYGNIHRATDNLLKISYIKSNLINLGVTSIIEGQGLVNITFDQINIGPQKILELLSRRKELSITNDLSPVLNYKYKNKLNINELVTLSEELAQLSE